MPTNPKHGLGRPIVRGYRLFTRAHGEATCHPDGPGVDAKVRGPYLRVTRGPGWPFGWAAGS